MRLKKKYKNMKSFFIFLSRNKLYTIINLLGLTISLAFIILLGAFVSKQMNTDSFQEKADRIFFFANEESFDGAYYLHKHLQEQFPEIESSTAIGYFEDVAHIYDDALNVNTMNVDSSFFDIFTIKTVEGDIKAFSESRDNIVISKSFANKIYGDKNPLGRAIELESTENELIIVAVVENIKNSVLEDADIFMRSEWLEITNDSNGPGMNQWGCCASAFLARENADLKAKEPEMFQWLKENCWIYKDDAFTGAYKEAIFLPLRDVYFYTANSNSEDPTLHLNYGNWRFVGMLLFACLGLLFFAIMNYINLTVAQTGFRAKEMATRRLLGTSKSKIIIKMILESTILSAIAFIFALLIAEGLAPAASTILEYQFTVWEVMTPLFITFCVASVLILGIFSGIIPALTISKFKPVDVMKGSFRTKTKLIYSKIFITLQNVITITMLIAAFTVFLQINHLINMPLNYNTKDIFVIDSWESFNYEEPGQMAIFREELKKMPRIEAVGFAEGTPIDGGNNNTMQYDGNWVPFQIIKGDSAYFNIMGFKVKKDNYLDDPNAKYTYFLNEYAVKKLNITEATPEFTLNKDTENEFNIQVAGLYYDFKIFSALRENSLALIRNVGEYDLSKRFPWSIVIKTQGDYHEAFTEIEKAYKAVRPDGLLTEKYYEELIEENYIKEKQLLTMISIFTVIAIIISALGLLAMSTYYVRQEEKDVAIRKVFGSTRSEILQKLVGIFMRYVIVAMVIAIPTGYYIMSEWRLPLLRRHIS